MRAHEAAQGLPVFIIHHLAIGSAKEALFRRFFFDFHGLELITN